MSHLRERPAETAYDRRNEVFNSAFSGSVPREGGKKGAREREREGVKR